MLKRRRFTNGKPQTKWRRLTRLLLIALAAYIFFGHVCRPMLVSGGSMEPTYSDGSFNFCLLPAYRFTPPEAGDIVILRFAGRRVNLLKRVVATAGQEVAFIDGVLHIDGLPVPEPYIKGPSDWQLAPRTVDPGHVYVIGDNRSVPMDHHYFGQASLRRIVGRPLW